MPVATFVVPDISRHDGTPWALEASGVSWFDQFQCVREGRDPDRCM
jgi:hypothetical protein